MKEWRNFLTSTPSTIDSSMITEEQRLRLEQLAFAVDNQAHAQQMQNQSIRASERTKPI